MIRSSFPFTPIKLEPYETVTIPAKECACCRDAGEPNV
jgi:hypothetical protein